MILLNNDFNQRAVMRAEEREWLASPAPGVQRQMLDRIGAEVARATSIVRYAAGSHFAEHTHEGGEEILVLAGVFSDERGDYPAGTYIRNPIGSTHTPFSKLGCTLFVKLHQFDVGDQRQLVINTQDTKSQQGIVEGLSVMPLHEFGTEHTALVRWAANTCFSRHQHWGGDEILVLEGTFHDEFGDYPQGTWIRSPHLSQHTPFSQTGCLIYVKTGHLHKAAEFQRQLNRPISHC